MTHSMRDLRHGRDLRKIEVHVPDQRVPGCGQETLFKSADAILHKKVQYFWALACLDEDLLQKSLT